MHPEHFPKHSQASAPQNIFTPQGGMPSVSGVLPGKSKGSQGVSPVLEVLALGNSHPVLAHSPGMHQAFTLIGFSSTCPRTTRTFSHTLQLAVSMQLGPYSKTLAIALRNINRDNDAPGRNRGQGVARNTPHETLFLPGSGSKDGCRSKALQYLPPLAYERIQENSWSPWKDKRFTVS